MVVRSFRACFHERSVTLAEGVPWQVGQKKANVNT